MVQKSFKLFSSVFVAVFMIGTLVAVRYPEVSVSPQAFADGLHSMGAWAIDVSAGYLAQSMDRVVSGGASMVTLMPESGEAMAGVLTDASRATVIGAAGALKSIAYASSQQTASIVDSVSVALWDFSYSISR